MANFGLYGVPKLMLKKVSKTYASARGQTDALHQIDLSVKSGEFVCIVGPSGCGKSTLLKLIAGLDAHTGGEILADGRRVSGPGTDRLLLFQEPALFPWLNVLHNVEFGLKMAGVPEKERREKALGVLELVNLLKFCNAYVHELSGGMKQKVALARALVMEPQMLLMDEPFAALDAQTRATLHEELQQAWLATKKTIIFVTHNVRKVRLADRVIVFQAARVASAVIPVNMARPRELQLCGDCSAQSRKLLPNLKALPRRTAGRPGKSRGTHKAGFIKQNSRNGNSRSKRSKAGARAKGSGKAGYRKEECTVKTILRRSLFLILLIAVWQVACSLNIWQYIFPVRGTATLHRDPAQQYLADSHLNQPAPHPNRLRHIADWRSNYRPAGRPQYAAARHDWPICLTADPAIICWLPSHYSGSIFGTGDPICDHYGGMWQWRFPQKSVSDKYRRLPQAARNMGARGFRLY